MLAEFLGASKGDVISFVGGGGKTSLMLSLAQELSERFRVVVTTTTRMGRDELEGIPGANDLENLERLLKTNGLAALYGSVEGRKVLGVQPEAVDACLDLADIVLVEADGSRRMPIKAPKSTEPVLVGSNTKTVIVFGFKGFDRPAGEVTYNAAGVPGLREDSIIDPAVLRRILLNGGYLEKISKGQVYVVINQAELSLARASEFACQLYHPRICAIALTSIKAGSVQPVNNKTREIIPIILAAGRSSRFNGNKLLQPFGGGLLIEQVLKALEDTGLPTPIIVVGHQEDLLLDALGERPLNVIRNPDYGSGMASSLKLGIKAAGSAEAVLVLLGDMPGVTTQIIKTVINAYRDSCAWAARAQFSSKPGHPVVIGRELFQAVMDLCGDTGARQVLGAKSNRVLAVEVDPGTQADIDTPADLERFKGENENA